MRMTRKLAVMFCLLAAALPLHAKPQSSAAKQTQPKADLLTAPLSLEPAAVNERLALLASLPTLPSAVRDWTSITLTRTAEALRQAEEFQSQLIGYEKQVTSATSQTEELRARLDALAAVPVAPVPTTATSALIAQWVAQKDAELAERQKAIELLEAERQSREARRTAIPKEIAEQQRLLERIDRGEEIALPSDPSGGWENLRDAALQALKLATKRRISAYEAELRVLDATRELFELRIEEAQKQLELTKKQWNALQAAAAEARQREAQEAIAQAQRARWEAARTHPFLKAIAEENELLARRRASDKGVPARLAAVTAELERVKQLREGMQSRFDSLRKRLELLERSDVVGQLMRKERDELPSPSALSRQLKQYVAEIAQIQAELMDWRGKRAELTSLERRIKEQLSRDSRFTSEDTSQIVSMIMNQRRSLLDALVADLDDLFSRLTELSTAYTLLIKETMEYAAFLDEHILWVRSMRPLAFSEIARAVEAATVLTGGGVVAAFATTVSKDFLQTWLLYIAVLLLIAAAELWCRRNQQSIVTTVARGSAETSFSLVSAARVVLWVLLRSLAPWVALLCFLGFRLLETPTGSPITDGIGNALVRTSCVVFIFLVISRALDLLESLFPQAQVGGLLRVVRGYGALLAVSLFVFVLAREVAPRGSGEALERFVFLATLALSLFFLQGISNLWDLYQKLRHGEFSHAPSSARATGVKVLVVAIIVILALLSASGFHYSALQLLKRLILSIGAVAAGALSLLLLYSSLNRVAKAHSLERLMPSFSRSGAAMFAGEISTRGVGDQQANAVAQVKRLIRASVGVAVLAWLWGIWADMLPAIAFVVRIPLWQRGESSVVGASAAVTVGDVLVAVVLAFMTVIMMRNVSGLLEVVLLRWTRIEQGTRYAVAAVVRYSIAIAGLMAVSKSLGITWKSVQWMAAAVTVGLGFGLQEIFANFVSGLILLFERPVRVGDWITVSGTTGIVTHIRTRATTVRDADGKELLIPNRLLITSPVVNWTLSDTGIRLTFDVRVSPDADEKDVRQALIEAAYRVTNVSPRPEPTVMLDAATNTEHRYRLFVFTNQVELRYEIKDHVIAAIRENLLSKPYQVLAVECALT